MNVSKEKRLNPEDRLCKYCVLKECENEMHFIITCPLYINEREKLLQSVYNHYPFVQYYNSEEMFIWLISNLDPIIIKTFALYI